MDIGKSQMKAAHVNARNTYLNQNQRNPKSHLINLAPPTPPKQKRQERKTRSNRNPKCYICRRRGHLTYDCPTKKPQEAEEINVVIVTEEVEIVQHEPIQETEMETFFEKMAQRTEIVEQMKEKPEEIEDETLREIGENIWKKFNAIVAKDDFEHGRLKGV